MTKRFYMSPVFSTVRPEDVPPTNPPGIVYKRKPTGYRRYKALFAPPPKKKRPPRQ